MIESGRNRPDWDEVASLSETAKTLWRQYDRLSVRNDVLIRRFEEANRQSQVWQIVMPRVMRSGFLMQCTPVWREGVLDVDGRNSLCKLEHTGQVGLKMLKELCKLALRVPNTPETNLRDVSDFLL